LLPHLGSHRSVVLFSFRLSDKMVLCMNDMIQYTKVVYLCCDMIHIKCWHVWELTSLVTWLAKSWIASVWFLAGIFLFATASKRWSRGSSGSIVSDYGLDDRAIEVRSPTGAEDFSSSPLRPDQLSGPPSLLSSGYWGFLPWG
jgi:hypothetical protein